MKQFSILLWLLFICITAQGQIARDTTFFQADSSEVHLIDTTYGDIEVLIDSIYGNLNLAGG